MVFGLPVVDEVVEGVDVWKGDFVETWSSGLDDPDVFNESGCCAAVAPRATKFWFVFDVWLDELSCVADTLFDVWDAGWKYVCIDGVP